LKYCVLCTWGLVLDINDVLLKKNAQFYKKNEVFNDDSIKDILEAASVSVIGTFDLNKESVPDKIIIDSDESIDFTYSIRVFKTNRSVPFVSIDLSDEVYAYIVLIECEDYVVIFKKSTANIEPITKQCLDLFPYSEIMSMYGSDDVEFQKISLRNMTVSDRAIRGKSFEAVNLKGLISTHTAGRSIPHSMRVKSSSETQTITTTTARIIEASDRGSLSSVAEWAYGIVKKIECSTSIGNFLSSFASPIKLSTVLSGSSPIALMFESSFINEALSNQDIEIKIKTKNGSLENLKKYVFDTLMDSLSNVYDIDAGDLIAGISSLSKIKRNVKSITFDIPALKRIRVIENGKELTLQSYIIKKKQYSICFSDPKYMYFMGECFCDTSGISEIDSILDILKVKPELTRVTDEKGPVSTTRTDFCINSAFGVVEELHASDDYIFCDDLGDEWADHITFDLTDACINFIHSKHGDLTNGASKFQDVVGQGIKNIGNMFSTTDNFSLKLNNTLMKNYKRDTVETQIARVRKGVVSDFIVDCNTIISNPRAIRKAILVCTFVSKSAVTTEFNKIKNNQPVRGHIIQLLWILSSFAHATKEANVIPEIYCQP
jgi:hypothetical protein